MKEERCHWQMKFIIILVVIAQTTVLILHESRLRAVEQRESSAVKQEDFNGWSSLSRKLSDFKEAVEKGFVLILYLQL